jgi:hypothetical protein
MSDVRDFFDKIVDDTNIHLLLKLLSVEDLDLFKNIIGLMLRGYISTMDLTHLLSISTSDKLTYISNIIDKVDISTTERTDPTLIAEVQSVLDDIRDDILVYSIPVNSIEYNSKVSTDPKKRYSYSSLVNFETEYTNGVLSQLLQDTDVFTGIAGDGTIENSFISYLDGLISYTVDNLSEITTSVPAEIDLSIVNTILDKFKKNSTTYLSDSHFYKILTKVNYGLSLSEYNPTFFTEVLNYNRYGRYTPKILVEIHNNIRDFSTQSEIQDYLISEIDDKIIKLINNSERYGDLIGYSTCYIEMALRVLSKTNSTSSGDSSSNDILGGDITILSGNSSYEDISVTNLLSTYDDLEFWLNSLRDILLYSNVYAVSNLILIDKWE